MSYFYKEKTSEYGSGEIKSGKLVAHIALGFLLFIGLLMAVLPVYGVWSKQQRGKGALAEAQFSKQVQLEEAKANLDSQKLNSQAEVERAKGAAQAIAIEDGKLTERYIQYLYVQNLEKLDTELIYVPTEGGLPLLESTRLNKGGVR